MFFVFGRLPSRIFRIIHCRGTLWQFDSVAFESCDLHLQSMCAVLQTMSHFKYLLLALFIDLNRWLTEVLDISNAIASCFDCTSCSRTNSRVAASLPFLKSWGASSVILPLKAISGGFLARTGSPSPLNEAAKPTTGSWAEWEKLGSCMPKWSVPDRIHHFFNFFNSSMSKK